MSTSSQSKSESDWTSLLRSVSRSFFLSIRLLPGAMREPIAQAYLLARLSDTIADSTGISLQDRIDCLHSFTQTVHQFSQPKGFQEKLDSLIPHVTHSGEKVLLANADQLLKRLKILKEANQSSIQKVIKTITDGQSWDLQKFCGQSDKATASKKELQTYIYQVAGCVGEFWTEIGYENLGHRFADTSDREVLLSSGRQLGEGLQLINILRDLHEDIPNNRNYLDPGCIDSDFSHWMQVCEQKLSAGRDYIGRVRNYRVRIATHLPLLLAEETAASLKKAGIEKVLLEKIKIPRSIVWKSMLKAASLRTS